MPPMSGIGVSSFGSSGTMASVAAPTLITATPPASLARIEGEKVVGGAFLVSA